LKLKNLFKNEKDTNDKSANKLNIKAKSAIAACVAFVMLAVSIFSIPVASASWIDSRQPVARMQSYDFSELGVTVISDDSKPLTLSQLVSVFFNEDYVEAYALYIDGIDTGITTGEDILYDVFADIAQNYSNENTADITFKNTVELVKTYADLSTLTSFSELRNKLDPDNTFSGLALTVETTEVTKSRVTLPFETVRYDEPELYIGDEEVRVEGKNGTADEIISTVFVNGIEQYSDVVGTVPVTSPVNKEIAVGSTERPLTASYGEFIWPTVGIMTSDFGPRNVSVGSSNHKGIDIVGDWAQEIWAADGGTVVYSGQMSGFGNIVQIQHDNGDVTYYAHCCELLVSVGEKVARGQTIALMGDTGTATAIHLHFEVRVNGEAVDPLIYLP